MAEDDLIEAIEKKTFLIEYVILNMSLFNIMLKLKTNQLFLQIFLDFNLHKVLPFFFFYSYTNPSQQNLQVQLQSPLSSSYSVGPRLVLDFKFTHNNEKLLATLTIHNLTDC